MRQDASATGPETRPPLPRPERLADLPADRLRDILERATDDGRAVESAAADIVQTVRELGDEGVLQISERFDRVRPERLVLGPEDFQAALDQIAPDLRRALERAAHNLQKVATATRPPAVTRVEVEPGLVVTERSVPIASVGCYVPGGKAAYPSSVLMAVVPAKAAGVPEVVVASPPGPDGRPPVEVLAACAVAGADACLVAGGAQAIAAFAYGIDSLDPVDKVVGPGNRYVTAAKRLVYGTVDIDSPAGPTEVLIVADGSVDPHWVALDLVAQAEHAEDSRCILVTPDAGFAAAVADALAAAVEATERHGTVHAALSGHGAILVTADDDEACAFARRYAPEHLQVMSTDLDRWRPALQTSAAVFLGPYAPVPVGDYLTGANHVLPTGGAARWASPLSVHQFLVHRVEEELTAAAAEALAEDLATLAKAEGLPAHARSMDARKTAPKPFDKEAR